MTHSSNRLAVRRVLIITLGFNIVIAFGKIIVGLISGALAITADGFHSLIDGASNVVGLIANHIASQPPDADHPYGHRRFETLAALMIGGFLVLAAWEIGWSAVNRLQDTAAITLTPLTFAVMAGTLLVNIGVSTYQIREGKRLNSELLLADAANTRTDVFVTLSVIVSMGIVALTGWTGVDTLAALVVVGLIGHAAYRILLDTGRVLVDTAPYSTEELTTLVIDVPGVRQVMRARSRGTVDSAHIDIDVLVDAHMTTAHTAALTQAIRERLYANLDQIAEIEVHFVPQQRAGLKNYPLIVRSIADKLGLATHEVNVIVTENRHMLHMHVEVPPQQSLREAHDQVTDLERDLLARLPELDEVITHIEPLRADPQRQSIPAGHGGMCQQVQRLLAGHFPQVDWHNLNVYGHAGDFSITTHAVLAPDMTVEAAHTLAENAEILVRAHMPELAQVTIHTEPHDHT